MNALARALNVSPTAVSEIVRGQRAISTVMAKRLSLFFGNSIQMWLNMQQHYEVKLVERQVGRALEREISPFDYSTLSKDTSSMVCESRDLNPKNSKTNGLTYNTRQKKKKATATSNKTSSGIRSGARTNQ
jgi:addiction module HigA family antidote